MLRDLPPLRPRISHDEEIFMNGAPGSSPHQHHQDHQAAAVDPLDDVFGSAPSSPTLAAHDAEAPRDRDGRPGVQYQDVSRLRTTHTTNGYREGVAASKEKYIQEGFDEGYSLGGEIGMKAGWCLGVLEGMLVAARRMRTGNSSATTEKVQKLLDDAQRELKLETLFGREYFEDGVWLYHVPEPADDAEPQITFGDVAARHPVLKKWNVAVLSLSKEYGLALPQSRS
ncbi:Hypothetical predicted protein [Lecanosticta acicola]|uniref:Protein YAE1 n=1 Tax=Lecanosticta acicola TaxID=111012 RepID=A0AAI8W222_9PEZI|nr:Hypothetical predicted protein [Lecanosticta acicola]